jgi:uncharacterized membrane protein YedE/YeeE
MIATTMNPPAVAVERRTSNSGPALAGAAIASIAAYLNVAVGWRQSALFLVGAFAGVALYHAAFGFTSGWRVFISDRRGAGLRAQMVMLAVTCLVFFPLLAAGSIFGQPLRGSISPAGVGVAVGAFIFGVGMQLGGGCASGTLYSAGGGSTRMFIVLAAFIAGSLIGTAHTQWWAALPSFAPTSLATLYGTSTALALSLALFGAIAWLTVIVERRHHGSLNAQLSRESRWLRGPWPLVAGALGLALVNVATLVIGGRPWGVTSAFALWGAKIAAAIGVPVDTWPYWTAPAQAAALKTSVLTDVTSVMDFGIVLGALLAALLAGRFAPVWKIPARSLAAAMIGGLLLGYGARIAYGCNIGAYFSGIASGSLHGWLWLPAAFVGNIVGTSFRPFFGLSVERASKAHAATSGKAKSVAPQTIN